MKDSSEAFHHLYKIKPIKLLAQEVHTTPIVLYRWGEAGEQHRTNPVEYVVALTLAAKHSALVDCICQKLGGLFVPDLRMNGSVPLDLVKARGVLMLHMGEFVAAVARAVLAGSVSPVHARIVRQCWNKLKSVGEAVVRACESNPRKDG